MAILLRSDSESTLDDEKYMGPTSFAFLAILLFTCCVASALLYLRRRKRLAAQAQGLPLHRQSGHQRTFTITTSPSGAHGDTVLIYDEKMNLLADTSHSSSSHVPEIRVTFPDEENQNGQPASGRVVVLRIADSGSVGMEPLHKDTLPPYQRSDAERFHSLDLERLGGLKEQSASQPRYS